MDNTTSFLSPKPPQRPKLTLSGELGMSTVAIKDGIDGKPVRHHLNHMAYHANPLELSFRLTVAMKDGVLGDNHASDAGCERLWLLDKEW